MNRKKRKEIPNLVKRNQPKLYGGLMSGTSADGIDAVVVEAGPKPRLLAHVQKAYPPALRKGIFRAFGGSVPLEDLIHLNSAVGQAFARVMLAVCRKAGLRSSRLAGIGSHGQTLWHAPGRVARYKFKVSGSLQIGEGSIIASRLGVPVVSDFRAADLAEGGQGAPLIPWAHGRLFGLEGKRSLVVNLGGIANLTLLSGRRAILGFDVGPGNMLLDGLCLRMTGGKIPFDRGGDLAAKGTRDSALLERLKRHPFLEKAPPKSTGREDFGERYIAKLERWLKVRKTSLPNALRTLCDFTAWCLADQVQRSCGGRGSLIRIVVHGGGLKNKTLMKSIRREFTGIPVIGSDDLGWPSQAVEAGAFALMAAETLAGRPCGIPASTGAKRAGVLGKVSLPPLRTRG